MMAMAEALVAAGKAAAGLVEAAAARGRRRGHPHPKAIKAAAGSTALADFGLRAQPAADTCTVLDGLDESG